MTLPVTDVTVLLEGQQVPPGFHRIPVDLNAGTTTGDPVYICYGRGDGPAITDLAVTENKQSLAGYTKIKVDLNIETDGVPLFLNYKRDGERPITDMVILSRPMPEIIEVAGYETIRTDLNKGAGGHFIYLYTRTAKLGPGVDFRKGITTAMVADLDNDCEITRAQVNSTTILVHSRRLVLLRQEQVPPGTPYDVTLETKTGFKKSDGDTVAKEVGIELGLGWSIFTSKVNSKLSNSHTSTYEVSEEQTLTRAYKFDKADHMRSFSVVAAAEVLRSVNMVTGETKEVVTKLPIDACFVTDENGHTTKHA